MKKLLISFCIISLLVISFYKTDKFTYIGDRLTSQATDILFATATIIFIVAFIYGISDLLKKKILAGETN